MEKMLAELLARLGEPGAGASVLTVIFLIFAYFKYLQPYLQDFEFIKNFLKTIPKVNEGFNDKLDKIQNSLERFNKIELSKMNDITKEILFINSKEHDKLIVEFGKIRYLIEEIVRKNEKISDRDLRYLNDIILELSKLQSKVEYINVGGLGGLQK